MALITLQELKEEAKTPRRGYTLTQQGNIPGYSDTILTQEIQKAQSYIQKKSGRIFTEKTFTQKETNITKSMIFLQYSPITEIMEFKINNIAVDENSYDLDSQHGIIEFDNVQYEFGYTITYKASEDPQSDYYITAKDICMDLIFARLQKPGDEKDVKSYKDGDFSVTYEEKDPMQEIYAMIKGIEKPVIDVIEV